MQIALEDLQLDNLTVIFPAHGDFPLATKIHEWAWLWISTVGCKKLTTHTL